MGLLACDPIDGARQVGLFRTTSDGTKVLKNSSIESQAELGTFVIVAASAEALRSLSTKAADSAGTPDSLLFGQPVLLRHVVSGRYLCSGWADEERRSVEPIPANISRENERLTLLPASLLHGSARGGCDVPEEAFVPACTFRFLPTFDHGRSEIYTDDPIWVVTDKKRLIRAGMTPLPAAIKFPPAAIETTSAQSPLLESDAVLASAIAAAEAAAAEAGIPDRWSVASFDEADVYSESKLRRASIRPKGSAFVLEESDEDEEPEFEPPAVSEPVGTSDVVAEIPPFDP